LTAVSHQALLLSLLSLVNQLLIPLHLHLQLPSQQVSLQPAVLQLLLQQQTCPQLLVPLMLELLCLL
jgi:hypothetical protein